MHYLKKYEDFNNEELNVKKILSTGALATGLALSSPAYSSNQDLYKQSIEFNRDTINLRETDTTRQVVDYIVNQNGINFTLFDNDKIKFSDIKDIKLQYTIAYVVGVGSGNHDDAGPFGMLLGLGTKDFSIYLDMKWDVGVFGIGRSGYREFDYTRTQAIENWMNETIIDHKLIKSEVYPGSYAYGTYREYESTKVKSQGTLDTRLHTTNIGFSKKLSRDNDYFVKAHLGIGLTEFEKFKYEKIRTDWSRSTWLNLIKDGYLDLGESESYELISSDRRTEVNLNAGITINLGPYVTGISFDTNPGCINFSMGFTFGGWK